MIQTLVALPLTTQFIIMYLIVINIAAFFVFGIDKIKSRLSKRRISEHSLWLISLIGGSLGGLLGMYFFRHKTKKISFQVGIAVILAIQVIFIIQFLA